jgi:hypothetical protein
MANNPNPENVANNLNPENVENLQVYEENVNLAEIQRIEDMRDKADALIREVNRYIKHYSDKLSTATNLGKKARYIAMKKHYVDEKERLESLKQHYNQAQANLGRFAGGRKKTRRHKGKKSRRHSRRR